MTIKEENTCYRFNDIINSLDSVAEILSLALTKLEYDSKDEAKHTLDLQIPIVAKILIDMKNVYTSISTTSYELIRLNRNQSNDLGVTFEIMEKYSYPCYKLTFPVSSSKRKPTTEMKQLMSDCYLSCVKDNIQNITRIAKPVIYFEHRFDKYGDKVSIKDVDNYETSHYINLLQMHLIKDDRNASTFHTNKFNASKNETVIYVLPHNNFLEFLSENTTF